MRSSKMQIALVSHRRATYLALALATIAIGLAVHFGDAMPATRARDVIGDALWAAMIVWWVGLVTPLARPALRCSTAYAICAIVEVSQAFHTPALDAIRANRIGQLVLGSGFDPRDLLAYALGVGAAALIDATLIRRAANRNS